MSHAEPQLRDEPLQVFETDEQRVGDGGSARVRRERAHSSIDVDDLPPELAPQTDEHVHSAQDVVGQAVRLERRGVARICGSRLRRDGDCATGIDEPCCEQRLKVCETQTGAIEQRTDAREVCSVRRVPERVRRLRRIQRLPDENPAFRVREPEALRGELHDDWRSGIVRLRHRAQRLAQLPPRHAEMREEHVRLGVGQSNGSDQG